MPIVVTAAGSPDITLVNIRWTSTYFDGLPALGYLYVEMSEDRVIDVDADEESIAVLNREVSYEIVPTLVTQVNSLGVSVDVEVGLAQFNLPASDDTDLFGTPFVYRVREELLLGGGGIFEFSVPLAAEAGGLDLSRYSLGVVQVGTIPRNRANGVTSLGSSNGEDAVRRAELAAARAEAAVAGFVPPGDPGLLYASTGATARWRLNDKADVRDFAASTGGTYGTGNSAKDTACIQEALSAMAAELDDQLGGPPVFIPAGVAYIEDPIVRTSPVPVHGASASRTILKPTLAMDGEWLWTDDGLNRNGQWTIGADTYDPLIYKGGADLRDLTFLGNRNMAGRYHGYRTLNSCDDLRHERLMIGFFNGTGYRLGDPTPTDGAGGTVRESAVTDLRVMGCGDATAGFDAWTVTQADVLAGGGDGTNQIDFVNPWFVTNWGPGRVGTGSATRVMRRVTFVSMMLHGLNASAADCDLLVIEGRVSGVTILGLRTNSSAVGRACIRWQQKNGATPGNQQVSGFHATAMDGSLFAIDDVEAIDLQGITGPGGIDEYEVTVAASSTAVPGTPAVGSGRFAIITTSATRKMNIPPNSAANISVQHGKARDTVNTSSLIDAADLVNTYGKRDGRPAFNTTTNKPVWATGPAPTDTWVDATGTLAHTPV